MRADEKIDPQLERAAEEEVVEQLDEKDAPAQEQAADLDTSALRFHELAAYIEALIAGQHVALEQLGWLSDFEQRALVLLGEAIEGHRAGTSRPIFAEDRMVMLEQALAALQPALAAGFESASADGNVYDDLVVDLAEVRASLSSLADAQEEVSAHDTMHMLGHGDDQPGKPPIKPPAKPDPGEVGDDRPSTVAAGGPAAPDWATPPSTLAAGGPAAPDPKAQPSTVATGGPASPDWATPPSTLAAGGPAAPDPKPQPSTAWDGDDRRR